MLDLVSELIFPNFCIGCSQPGVKLCKTCIEKIEVLDNQTCVMCEGLTTDGRTHLVCMKNNKYAPEKALVSFVYSKIVKKIILKAKSTGKVKTFIEPLTSIPNFAKDILSFKEINFITHIPASSKLTTYLATHFSKSLGIPQLNLFKSALFTYKQKNLDRAARFINVKESLYINPSHIDVHEFNQLSEKLINKRFLVIDDVSTSGATLLYATYLLKKAGAKDVYVYALAKDLMYN